MTILLLKSLAPAIGDKVNFESDRHTDKGPCESVPVVGVEGTRVTLAYGDEQEIVDWAQLRAQRHGNGRWLVKALHTHPAPTPAQQEAGNYAKRVVRWRGLQIAIENEVGSVRRGIDKGGHNWAITMKSAYGYVKRSTGIDGDEVDVYLGPNLDAQEVYVVHQRRAGDWDRYDEDKCMVGFSSEAAAGSAYLDQYSDPRFLGPITAMTAEAFVKKVKATKGAPAMIKALLIFLGAAA